MFPGVVVLRGPSQVAGTTHGHLGNEDQSQWKLWWMMGTLGERCRCVLLSSSVQNGADGLLGAPTSHPLPPVVF